MSGNGEDGRRPTTEAPPQSLAVLGDPIAHSKSPAIHTAAYRELGLDWSYTRVRCDETELAGFLETRSEDWRGLSLTMPLKEEARRLARVLDPVAEESGVVNTLLRLAGDAGWAGFNTDVGGLAAAIRNAGLDASRTIVIGSGATAVSAILAARRLGAAHVELLARNTETVADLVGRFDGSTEPGRDAPLEVSGTGLLAPEGLAMLAGRADAAEGEAAPTLVVSTLPGSAGAGLELPVELTRIPLFDVAYDPWPSPLAERWHAAGGAARPGVDMLVEQALIQIRIFSNGSPDAPLNDEARLREVMRAASVE